uniref:Bromo domain-containing protein n=2 Tax=Oryza brachyantha TaxID=4533 RepID=J3ML98_ORYBR
MARTTPLPDRKALDMILDKLQKKDTYGVFAEPVDPEELPDYHDVIEHPMDFGTVRRKLARNAYRSFEQFEDDVFLICSNAMQYNAPDTIYFRQAHSIQELARKKFQELRDEGIPTENQIKSEQKIRPNSCNREPIKKPVLRYSDDDLGFMSHKEQVSRPNSKNLGDDLKFKDQVKKHISRNSEDVLSSSFQKERVKKSNFRNSDDDLSSSFHKEQVKRPISRNSGDDLSSSVHKEQARKVISRNSENERVSSFHKKHDKKPTSRNSKDELPSQEKHIRKPVCRNSEDADFLSNKDSVENPVCTNGEHVGVLSPKRLVEKPICQNRDDVSHSQKKELNNKPICGDGRDDMGYSCNTETVKKPVSMNSQDALGSDVSAATVASAGDGSNGLSMSQANAAEPLGCMATNGFMDKDISSPLDEIRSEKTDDISARESSVKPSYKSIVVDETRRKTYDTYEEQPSSESDAIFDVFSEEPKELASVGPHSDHSYARSLARFAGSLGAQGWRLASERIQQVLPTDVKFGRGWVGEYEPPLPSILFVENQSRSLVSSESNIQKSASMTRNNERMRPTGSVNPKEMSLSLNQITTGNNMVGVPGPLESPEIKPRLFGVTAEPQQRNTNASSLHENHRVSGSVAKTKRAPSEQTRKGSSSSSSRTLQKQPQRPECSKGPSGVLDMPPLNKMAGQPRPFFQPAEAAVTQQMRKSESSKNSHPLEMAHQRLECAKGATSGVQDMPTLNSASGQPKPFFQSQEAAVPQPRNENTWVYHGRPGDGKYGTSDKSRPMNSMAFITKNQPVNAASFAMNLNGQKNVNDNVKSVGSTVMPGQVNTANRGPDSSRNIFSAFPAAVRENQSIPSAPMAQSWISFGTSSESKPTIVSPTFHDSNSGWKMPFANARPDEAKITAVPQFFRQQPSQMVRESSVQNKGLVIFPQLVQTDFSRSQGQPQWQGLVPHMQQKPNKDMLRPDLNIGFPSPGSPPARQSSGINLEAQQPDLALQL